MFGNLGEMANLLQKAKSIQKNVAQLKEDLASAVYEGLSADAKVAAKVSGDFQLLDLQIKPSVTAEELASDVKDAVNAALGTARLEAQAKMKELTGGLNIPGL